MQKTIFSLILLVCLSSCFQTRNVEPPDSLGSDWVSPTNYEQLLQNFKKAVQNGNEQNYIRCLSASNFQFTPTAAVYNGNESIWQNWLPDNEKTYLLNIRSAVSGIGNNLEINVVDEQTSSADSVKYIANYTLTIPFKDSTICRVYKGQMILSLKLNLTGEWEMLRWTDVETHQDSAWSNLKLRFKQ